MRIPTKIQHGDKVISTVYAKINGIIDYLNASRVKPGTGIRVQETPSGTVVSSVPNSMTPPQLNAGGSGGSVIGFPDFTNGSTTDTSSHQVTGGDVWIGVSAIVNENNSGSGGWVQLIISESAYDTALYTPTVVQYEGSNIAVAGSILVPVRNGLFYRIQVSGSVTVTATIYPSIQ